MLKPQCIFPGFFKAYLFKPHLIRTYIAMNFCHTWACLNIYCCVLNLKNKNSLFAR